MRASRGTCFSALSWRRAPTKSRLTMRLRSSLVLQFVRAPKKRNVGVTHVLRRPFEVGRSIHPDPRLPQRGAWPAVQPGLEARARVGRFAALDRVATRFAALD